MDSDNNLIGSGPQNPNRELSFYRNNKSDVDSSDDIDSSRDGGGEDQAFVYEQLLPRDPSGSPMIRLLCLLPRDSSGAGATVDENLICAEVEHVSLEDAAEEHAYKAISYCWGTVPANRRILLNGCSFFITESLHVALDALCGQEPVYVWADAICINQQSSAEKSHQVPLMRDIYGCAAEVVIHLGPGTEESNFAVDLLELLAAAASTSTEQVEELIRSADYRNNWRALVQDICCREWWDRLWVVQEVALAMSSTIFCGQREIPRRVWDDAMDALDNSQSALREEFGVSNGYAHFLRRQRRTWYDQLRLMQIWGLGNDHPEDISDGQDMLDVLYDYGYRNCEKPVDKIYGLMALFRPEQRAQVAVDYNASMARVFTSAAETMITSTGTLDVICHARRWPRYSRPDRLPSWVPDWAFAPQGPPFYRSTDEANSGGGTDAQYEFHERGRVLAFKGFRVDAITTCGMSTTPPGNMEDTAVAFAASWQLIVNSLPMEMKQQETIIRLAEEFCEVLYLGHAEEMLGDDFVDNICAIISQECEEAFGSESERISTAMFELKLVPGLRQLEVDLGVADRARLEHFRSFVVSNLFGTQLFLTDSNHIGMSHGGVDEDDVICVPLGCPTPVVLRDIGGGQYEYMSDAYVYGFMNGEAIDEWERGERELEEFVLV